MSPSRLAFVQEFERQLSSPALRAWFDGVRCRDLALAEFGDPSALRRFLHSDEGLDPRKPEIWRTLVRELQAERTPEAVTFVLGLLEPALGGLIDGFKSRDLDRDDLWQEAVACALRALSNPRVTGRRAVLVGLVLDTWSGLRWWLRAEFAQTKHQRLLADVPYMPDLDGPDGNDEEELLAVWCRAAHIDGADAALISAARLSGLPLSRLAPAQSRTYHRLWKRRQAAEVRLKAWLKQGRSSS